MSRGSQEMPVIRIEETKACLGRGGQVNRIGRPQKHRTWKLPINVSKARQNFFALREPAESSGLDMRLYLADERGIRRRSNGPFPQLAMERSHHFRLPVRCTCEVVCRRERTNRVGAGILIVEPDEIARIEVDHSALWSRSSLIVRVESVPPRRDLR